MSKIYALYKGDNFIDMGTRQYLATLLNVSIRTIDFYMTPTHLRRVKDNAYIVIKVDNEEEDV